MTDAWVGQPLEPPELPVQRPLQWLLLILDAILIGSRISKEPSLQTCLLQGIIWIRLANCQIEWKGES